MLLVTIDKISTIKWVDNWHPQLKYHCSEGGMWWMHMITPSIVHGVYFVHALVEYAIVILRFTRLLIKDKSRYNSKGSN